MKTIAILLVVSGTLVAHSSFAQIRLGGGAHLAAGAAVSTPGVSHAMRTTTTTVRSTSKATIKAGHETEVKTVSTTDNAVHAADQTAVNSSAKVEASANGAEKQTAAQAQSAAQGGASTQSSGSAQASANGTRPTSTTNANVRTNSIVNGQVNTNKGQVKTSTDVHAAAAVSAVKQ